MHMYLTQSNYQKEPKSSDFGESECESESDLPKKKKKIWPNLRISFVKINKRKTRQNGRRRMKNSRKFIEKFWVGGIRDFGIV